MLEMYIIEMREKRGFLPNLKTINRLPLNIKDLGDRVKQGKILKTFDNLWKYCGSYRLVKPGVMDEEPTFYINDELGSAITHSDTPNVKMAPMIFSPNN